MRLASAAVFIMATLLLSACAVHQNPAQTRITTPYGSVKYHCPPGQAKKGKCHPAGGYHHYRH